MTGERAVIGVISDTHGLLRPEALAALAGSDYIIHAGDVGPESILHTLERVAPVTVVRGNVDTDAWARRLPTTGMLEAAGARIYIVHDLGDLDVDPSAAEVAAVVSGHSHRPVIDCRGDVLFLNPGAAGARRFSLPVTVARMTVEAGRVEAEIVEIVPSDSP